MSFLTKQQVTEKPWALETVWLMLFALMLSFLTAMILGGLASHVFKSWSTESFDSLNFILGALGFQGSMLIWAAWLVRVNKINWAIAFGMGNWGVKAGLRLAAGAGIGLTVIALPLGWIAGVIMSLLGYPPEAQAPVKLLEAADSLPKQVLFGSVAIFLAPAGEEVLFRGILYPTIKQMGYPRLALFGTSLLFGVIHFNWMALIPLTVIAMLLVWLYEQTGDLLIPIAAHSCFNLINVVLLTSSSWFHP